MAEPCPKVTACLITYNHIRYISQAIESVLVQKTDFPFEIVIADDCSTDGTQEIIKEYKKKYPDIIRLILQEKNIGPALNSIELFKAARGEYIAYLDCDDFWTDENKLQKQFNFLDKHPDFAICFHNTNVIFENPKRKPFLLNVPGQKSIGTIEDILRKNFIASPSAMFRKVVIDDLPDWFVNAPYGDWCLHILGAQIGKIKYFDEVMASYRVHNYGTFSNSETVEVHLKNIKFYEFIERNIKPEYLHVIHQEISKRFSEISYHYRGENQFLISFKYDLQNIKFSFSHKKVNKLLAIRDTLKEVILLIMPPILTNLLRYLR